MNDVEVCSSADEIKQSSLRNDAFSRSAWLEEGMPLLLSEMTNKLQIGDWALKTPAEARRDEVRELLEEAAARARCDVGVISAYRTVAKRIPLELRKAGLTWYAYKEISKLSVSENGSASEEKSLALRAEFIEKFAALPNAKARTDIRAAVRERMHKKTIADEETQTVSFKLTNAEFASLKAIVEAHPIHDSISDFVQELVRNCITLSEPK